jgi:hypothetical protein
VEKARTAASVVLDNTPRVAAKIVEINLLKIKLRHMKIHHGVQ